MLTRVYKEKGNSYGSDYIQPYICTYTQPLHNHIIAWMYHFIWEKLTWRIYQFIEKKWPAKDIYDEDKWLLIGVPVSVRQDLRCYELHHRNKIVIEMIYGEKTSRSWENR